MPIGYSTQNDCFFPELADDMNAEPKEWVVCQINVVIDYGKVI